MVVVTVNVMSHGPRNREILGSNTEAQCLCNY